MFLVLLYQGGTQLSGLKPALLSFLECLCGLRLSHPAQELGLSAKPLG